MWLSSVFLKTLRDYRIPILGWGIGMGLVVVSPMASVAALLTTPEARAQLASLAATFAWNADPVAVTTIGGYATFKIGIFIFLIVVWPILAGSRMLRGEEERGSLDVLLSVPRPRLRIALEKLAAMWTALLAMGLLIGLIVFAGGRQFGADFGLGDALLFGLDLALICAVFGGLSLLISQFTQERGPAAGATAGLLLVFLVLDMVHRIAPNSEWISRLSPIYYYNLNKALIPSYGVNAGAMLLLAVLAIGLGGMAVWLFNLRDVGGTVPLPRWLRLPERQASRVLPLGDWSLRSVYARSLRTIAMPTFWWTLGIAGFAGWMVYAVQLLETKMSTLLSGNAAFTQVIKNIGGGDASLNAGFLSAMFVLLPLFLMAFAVTQVNGWSADEQDGRLELVLATPHRHDRHQRDHLARLRRLCDGLRLAAERRQSRGGHPGHNPARPAGRRHRLPGLRLVALGGGYRPLELSPGVLVLRQFHRAGAQPAGRDASAVALLLLRLAAAERAPAHVHHGHHRGRRRGASPWRRALRPQRHRRLSRLATDRRRIR